MGSEMCIRDRVQIHGSFQLLGIDPAQIHVGSDEQDQHNDADDQYLIG